MAHPLHEASHIADMLYRNARPTNLAHLRFLFFLQVVSCVRRADWKRPQGGHSWS